MKKPMIQDKDLKLHRPADANAGETYDPAFIPVGGDRKVVQDGLYFTWCDCPDCAIRVFSSYQYPLIITDEYEANQVRVTGATVTTIAKQLPRQHDAYQGNAVIPTGGRVQSLLTNYKHPDPDAYQGNAVIPTGGYMNNLLTNYKHPDPDAYQGGAVIPTGGRLWADLVRYGHPAEDAYTTGHVKVEEITLRSR